MILRNCRLLPELSGGYDGGLADIVLEGNRIAALCPTGTAPSGGNQILDVAGQTVLPGLIDLHVHLAVSGLDLLVDNAKAPSYRALESYKFAMDTLRAGFTTLRDVGDVDRTVIALRNFFNEKKLPGPRILASGKVITTSETGNDYFAGMYSEANGPAAIRHVAREEFKAGADFLKIMVSGAVSNPGGVPGMTICEEDELRELVKIAQHRYSYVAAHCHSADSVLLSLKCGVRTIEHGTVLDDACMELLGRGESYLVPTMCCMMKLLNASHEFSGFMQEKTRALMDAYIPSLTRAYQAGLKLGFGTDTGTTDNFHGFNGEEFIYRFEQIHMEPLDILKQATIYSAQIAGIEEETGSIEPGKCADLVVVNGAPDQDIYLMTKGISTVIRNGQIVI